MKRGTDPFSNTSLVSSRSKAPQCGTGSGDCFENVQHLALNAANLCAWCKNRRRWSMTCQNSSPLTLGYLLGI